MTKLARPDRVGRKRKATFGSPSLLGKPGNGHSIINCSKNEIVFSQGDPADAVFYVQKGKLKALVVSDRRKEAVPSILGPGEFFGEACMAGQPRRLATVSAMTDAIVVRIEKPAMARLIHEQSDFLQMFMTHVLHRAVRVEADLIDQLFISSERRLARQLLLLANYGREGKPEPITKISQEILAEMIGPPGHGSVFS